MTRRTSLVLGLVLLAGCAGRPDAVPAGVATAASPGWRSVITGADRQRLARLWDAWTRALGDATAAGQEAAVAALGPLAVPDAATMHRDAGDAMLPPPAGPLPGPGSYRCRIVKIGHHLRPGEAPLAVTARPAVVAGNPVACRITARADGLWFEIAASAEPQRLAGRLFADGDRLVFLGTTALAGEMGVMAYGADPERDAVGALRAMAPARWRLELPWPAWQATLALVDIVPE